MPRVPLESLKRQLLKDNEETYGNKMFTHSNKTPRMLLSLLKQSPLLTFLFVYIIVFRQECSLFVSKSIHAD